ncbi:MAG TPA: hypothetical protein VK599_10440 [Streptosporangiaceae bacterium]|nr:hypothetical protein [Streptosporangiaceae bacterium]
MPVPDAPDSCCVVVAADDGRYVQHYFDSRGVARLYVMTIDGQWQSSDDGRQWTRDFGLTYTRVGVVP